MSTPKFPDFHLEYVPFGWRGQSGWHARTDTGRPGRRIFQAFFTSDETEDEAAAREVMTDILWDAYRGAHPNGCPGGVRNGL